MRTATRQMLRRAVAHGVPRTMLLLEVEEAAFEERLEARRLPLAISARRFVALAARALSIDPGELRGRSRERRLNDARKALVLVATDTLNLSSPEVGLALGGRDHTSVLYLRDAARAARDSLPIARNVARLIAHVRTVVDLGGDGIL